MWNLMNKLKTKLTRKMGKESQMESRVTAIREGETEQWRDQAKRKKDS